MRMVLVWMIFLRRTRIPGLCLIDQFAAEVRTLIDGSAEFQTGAICIGGVGERVNDVAGHFHVGAMVCRRADLDRTGMNRCPALNQYSTGADIHGDRHTLAFYATF